MPICKREMQVCAHSAISYPFLPFFPFFPVLVLEFFALFCFNSKTASEIRESKVIGVNVLLPVSGLMLDCPRKIFLLDTYCLTKSRTEDECAERSTENNSCIFLHNLSRD